MPRRRIIPKSAKVAKNTKRVLQKRTGNPNAEIKTTAKNTVVQYEKAQCAHVDAEGYHCPKNAVGKSTMCKRHNPSAQEHQVLVASNHLPVASKFDPNKHVLGFIKCCNQGLAPVEIAAEFKISKATLLNWAETYPQFHEAVEIGKAAFEAFWLTKGRSNLETRGFSWPGFKFLTANTLGWAEKAETTNTNINTSGVLLMPQAPETESAWEEAAASLGDPNIQDAEILKD